MKEKLYQRLIELTNGKQSSHLLQTIAKAKWSKRIIPSYMKLYDINLEEVSKKQQQFSCLHDFFTRELIEEARPIEKIQLSMPAQWTQKWNPLDVLNGI